MSENINLEENIENFVDLLDVKNQQNNLINLSSLGSSLPTDDSASIEDSELVKKYFESSLTSEDDKKLKKIAMAATLLAKQKGELPNELKDLSTEKLFSVMDNSLNQVKIAYQFAEGSFGFETEDDAFEQLLDAAAARVKTLIDNAMPALKEMAGMATEKYLPFAIDRLMDVVDSSFPQATCVTAYVRQFSPVIANKLKPAVKKGVELLGNYAKTAMNHLADAGKSLWRYAKNWLNS